MDKLIQLHQIVKTYISGGMSVLANDRVDFNVANGEKIILMGPSGSGKTTLLLIAGCLLKPCSGRVFLKDKEITSLSEKELAAVRLSSIGFVFQSFNLLPLLTVLENVALPAMLLGLSKIKAIKKAESLLENLGLGARLNHLPGDLSAGEKQRVAVARAVINNPVLILADEPTANLDSQNGRQVIQLLCQGIKPGCGRSVIFASHDQRIIPFVDRQVLMEDGKIIRKSQL
jgi:putative ABC transport system ATP-binding protein